MDSDNKPARFSYPRFKFLAILNNDYTQTLVKHVSEDPDYEFLRSFHKMNVKRFAKKNNDDPKGSAPVLCPEKRSWTTGCHVEPNSSSKPSSNLNQNGLNFIRGVNTSSGNGQILNQQKRFVRGTDHNQYNDQKSRSIMGMSSNTRQQNDFRRTANNGSNGSFNRNRGGGNLGGLFTRNNYHPIDKYSNDRCDQFEEEEPEWFSEGPTSFRDTIELGGIIDDDLKSESSTKTSCESKLSDRDKNEFADDDSDSSFKLISSNKNDQGGSRLLRLIAPIKADEDNDLKQAENKLRSLLLRSDESISYSSIAIPAKTSNCNSNYLTLEEIEAQELGARDPEGFSPDEFVSPLKNFLNSITNQTLKDSKPRPQSNLGASKIFSMITEVAQQNAKRETGHSFDSDNSSHKSPEMQEESFADHTNMVHDHASIQNRAYNHHADLMPNNTTVTIIDSLFDNSPIKPNMLITEDSTANVSSLLARYRPKVNDPTPDFMMDQQQRMHKNNTLPPPGFVLSDQQTHRPASSILSSLNMSAMNVPPPGLLPSCENSSIFGAISSYPQQRKLQQHQPVQNQHMLDQNMTFARLLAQVQQQKINQQQQIIQKVPVSGARAIVKHQRSGTELSLDHLHSTQQSFINIPSTESQQAPPPGFATQQTLRRPIAGSQTVSPRTFIPPQVQQQLAAKAKANGDINSSIFHCRMHLEQQKSVLVAGGHHLGRPITSDKTPLPAEQNHY